MAPISSSTEENAEFEVPEFVKFQSHLFPVD